MLIQHLPRRKLSRKIQSVLSGSIILKNEMMCKVEHVGGKSLIRATTNTKCVLG